MKSKILSAIFPERCVFCRELTSADQWEVCPKCAVSKNLVRVIPPFPQTSFVDKVFYAAYFKDEVRQSVHRFKFSKKPGYARAYARYMFTIYSVMGFQYDAITWVPSNPYTVFKRGYNQAHVLAKELAKHTGLPLFRTLGKIRKTDSMYKLTASQRRANVFGAYSLCCKPEQVKAKRILLIDDIYTTGATASECGRILTLAGASAVGVGAFAFTKP